MPTLLRPWFDGHLDLACMALEGRDLHSPLAAAVGPPQPATVTLPSLADGGVTHCLATLFTGLGTNGPCGYDDKNDPEKPHACGIAQLGVYSALVASGDMRIVRAAADLADSPTRGLASVLLMEGADPIRNPGEAAWWFEQGVRVIGLTWARGTRYAAGNSTPGPLTAAGRSMVAALEELGVIHDLSHLADEAARELLARSTGPVLASHSDSRAICRGHGERNLPDDLIRAVAERNGLIGLNLFSLFLTDEGDKRRAKIDETVAHVEHIVDVSGRHDLVALGSDMDGGFGSDRLPEGINAPCDLPLLLGALSDRGWTDDQLAGFRFNNWARFLRRSLPR